MNVFQNMFVFKTQSKTFKRVLLCFILILSHIAESQTVGNLINNYSFETFTGCPDNNGQVWRVQSWFNANQSGSPDFFTPCATTTICSSPSNFFGLQAARTGFNYLGMALYINEFVGREPIETQLKQTLQSNKSYCVTFYVSLAEFSRFAIANVNAYFTSSVLTNTVIFPVPFHYFWPPHVESNTLSPISDTLNWIKVQGIFAAQGGENFLTLGNFRDDTQTNKVQTKPLIPSFENGAYYYIDDISIVEINPAKAYTTKTITTCANTTFTLGTDSTWDATYQWQPTTGLSCTNCPNPIITATANTKYVLTKQQCSATTKDSVYIQIYTPTLTANAGNFKSICLNDTVTLGANDTTAFSSYTWQPTTNLSCTNCSQPVTTPFTTTTYTLTKNECSLTTSDTVSVYVDACEVIIPDIFTPNNDNINDEWKIKLPAGFKLKAVNLYNRWGTLIYNIDDETLRTPNSELRTIRWDGRTTSGIECSESVYFYVIHYTDKSGILHKLNGNVTLMR